MKTPIDGAKLSSTFGMRMHPILGYRWKQPTINSHKKINPNELDSY